MEVSVARVSRSSTASHLIEVIARYVEALGARLHLVVDFGDRTLRLPVSEKSLDERRLKHDDYRSSSTRCDAPGYHRTAAMAWAATTSIMAWAVALPIGLPSRTVRPGTLAPLTLIVITTLSLRRTALPSPRLASPTSYT